MRLDLTEIVEFISQKWPDYRVLFYSRSNGQRLVSLTYDNGRQIICGEGTDDSERLAHAVKQALEAEA